MQATMIALAVAGMLLAETAGMAEDDAHVCTRAGDKQGPLLLLDDLRAALAEFLAGAPEAAADTSAVDAMLDGVVPPAEEAWRLPEPPELPEGQWVFVPPMPRGCNNSSGGTGLNLVEAGEHRGQFTIDLRAGAGQDSWALASPCLVFTPDRDGMVRCRTAIVLHGALAADAQAAGDTLLRIGTMLAHCHPKDRGSYSERVALEGGGMTGMVRLDNAVLLHEATFPVQGGVEHLFGVGVTGACAARAGTAGMRLFGRVAYLTVEMQ